MTNGFRFAIGTQYKTPGRHPRICTVSDQITVTNSKGEVVRRYYHSTHEFMGQVVTDRDVCETTIARNQIQ